MRWWDHVQCGPELVTAEEPIEVHAAAGNKYALQAPACGTLEGAPALSAPVDNMCGGAARQGTRLVTHTPSSAKRRATAG